MPFLRMIELEIHHISLNVVFRSGFVSARWVVTFGELLIYTSGFHFLSLRIPNSLVDDSRFMLQ